MTDRIDAAVDAVRAVALYLTGLPPITQGITAATVASLLGYAEYRRRTRTTPTLRHRAGTLTSRSLRAAWAALRTPPNADQKTKLANTAENALVFFFVFVVAGLIMQGLIPFARDDMGLTGVWPYMLFFALDGMAAYFGLISYRLAKEGAKATSPRVMVLVIVGGSAWFQWSHASDRDFPARVAWAALPIIAGYLWETVLKYRRRAWRKAQPDTGRQVPRARWMWDPLGSAGITRRTHKWNLATWEEGLETHMVRTECIRQLRREFGLFWFWCVPADVAIRLKKGFKVEKAALRVPDVIEAHRREVENQRLVKAVERETRSGAVPPGTYTVSFSERSMVDRPSLPEVVDEVQPLENPQDVPEEPGGLVPASDPWETAPHVDLDAPEPWDDDSAGDAFVAWANGQGPAPAPRRPGAGSQVVREPQAEKFTPPVLPVDERGRQITPKPGEAAFQKAVDLYLSREREGSPLTGREVCRLNGVNPDNRLWRQSVIRAAKEQQAQDAEEGGVLF